jgi:hypothetical protein
MRKVGLHVTLTKLHLARKTFAYTTIAQTFVCFVGRSDPVQWRSSGSIGGRPRRIGVEPVGGYMPTEAPQDEATKQWTHVDL